MLICEMNIHKKELDLYLKNQLRKSRFPKPDGRTDISSYRVASLLKNDQEEEKQVG